MADLFRCAALAVMTPGLGNILDAARTGVPTLWLPPANDSQARQIDILQHEGLSDAAIGWHEIGETVDINAPQPEVMRCLNKAVGRLHTSSLLSARLTAALANLSASTAAATAPGLLVRFGDDGDDGVAAVVRHITAWLQEASCPPTAPCASPFTAASASPWTVTPPYPSTPMPN